MTPLQEPHRSDIDGLRAIAIAGVVLSHAGVPGFSGGFSGIDILFVVSGYLLTARLAEGPFDRATVLAFYLGRLRRIGPPLLAMLGASAAVAAVLLLPADFMDFGKSLVAATLFVSNFWFWPSVDIASDRSNLIPLLHTWAVSAGVQIWLVFPLVLVVIHRWGRGSYATWLAVLFVLSLAFSAGADEAAPMLGYFMAPARAWEFLLGSLLALRLVPAVSHQVVREALGALGLWLVAWSYVTFSTLTPFPGYAALAPCLGAALLIVSGRGDTQAAANRLLSLPPIAFHGIVAYSLYLWHWPILVFARYWNGAPLSAAQTAFFVSLSVVVAILSWALLERSFRARRIPRTVILSAAAAATALLVMFGIAASFRAGWPGRFDNYRQAVIAGGDALKGGRCLLSPDQGPWNYAGLTTCEKGDEAARSVVVWGDAYAAHLVPGLTKLAGEDMGIAQYSAEGCPPILHIDVASNKNCRAFNDAALRVIDEAAPDIVVLAADWHRYLAPLGRDLAELQATVNELRELGYKVMLVGQSPSFDFRTPSDFAFRHKGGTAHVNFGANVNERLMRIGGAEFFDPMAELCDGVQCRLRDERGGYLYMNDGQLSSRGSARLASILLPILARIAFSATPTSNGAANGADDTAD